jgi:hypothetical protein
VLVVGSYNTGLFRFVASGGAAVPLTTVDASAGELGHAFPQFLPDGRHVLFLCGAPAAIAPASTPSRR